MKFVRNVSWIFSANLIVSLAKWIVLILIARILTPEDVGVYSLAFSISAPITLFANMKLRLLYITEDNNDFGNFYYSRSILNVFTFIILLVVATLIYPEYFYIINLVGVMKILDLQSDLYYALPHKKTDMNYIGKLMIIKHITTFSVFFMVILTSRNLILSLILQLISQFLFLIFFEKKNILRKYYPKREGVVFSKVKKIILVGIPLGFVQMMFSFNVSYSRFLLESFESAKVLGYYSAIAYILVIGTLLVNAVSQNFLPIISTIIKEEKYYLFKRYVFIYYNIFAGILGLIIIFFSIAFGDEFLSNIYGEDYSKYSSILILMSISLIINLFSSNFDIALLAMKYISIQPKITSIVLIINLVLGYYMIKMYGIYGAAYSIIITNAIQLLLRGVFVAIKLKSLSINRGKYG